MFTETVSSVNQEVSWMWKALKRSVPVGYKYLINGYKRGQVPVHDETVLYGVHDQYGIGGDVCLRMNV